MIKEIKDLLETVVSERIAGIAIARSIKEESHAVMARRWPLVSLITNPGRFDDREARMCRTEVESGTDASQL